MAIRVAVFDLDGTLLTGTKTVVPTFAKEIFKTGQRQGLGAWLFAQAFTAALARKLRLISRERLTLFGTQLTVRYMAAVEPAALEAAMEATVRRLLPGARPEVVAEVSARRAEGCRPVIVSAVIQPLLDRLAVRLGCEAIGTRLEVAPDGRYTGRLQGPYCSGPGKTLRLHEWAAVLPEPVDWAHSYAYADTLPDLPVLEAVGHAVAVAPEAPLRRLAEVRGWRVMG